MRTHRSRRETLPVRPKAGKDPDLGLTPGLTPLDIAEALQASLERIDALAFVVLEHLPESCEGGAAGRRFTRLLGTLADTCEEAQAAGAEAIRRAARVHRAGS